MTKLLKNKKGNLVLDGRVQKCPACGSDELWNTGATPSREGPKQRVKCTRCAKSWYPVRRRHRRVVSIKPSAFVENGGQDR